jgi:hypothetical protein
MITLWRATWCFAAAGTPTQRHPGVSQVHLAATAAAGTGTITAVCKPRALCGRLAHGLQREPGGHSGGCCLDELSCSLIS